MQTNNFNSLTLQGEISCLNKYINVLLPRNNVGVIVGGLDKVVECNVHPRQLFLAVTETTTELTQPMLIVETYLR